MNLNFLKKLRSTLVELKFERGQTPKTELDWVRALATKVLGTEITADEWKFMCERRNRDESMQQLVKESMLVQSGNDQVLAASLTNLDLEHPIEELLTVAAKRASASTAPGAASSSSSAAAPAAAAKSSSSSAAPAGPRKAVVIDYEVGDDIIVIEARSLLPSGFTMLKDTTLHMRWQAKFKDSAGLHRYFSKGWGPKSDHTIRSALRHVLQEAWAFHTTRAAEACPWNFRAAV